MSKFRYPTLGIPATLAGAGLWLMDGWIANQGWAAWDGRKWAVAAAGWPLVVQAWPVGLASATLALAALWPLLAQAARRQAEAGLAGRLAELERQSQGLERKRQAIEQDKRESQARLDASRQELSDMHTRRLAEIEAGAAKARTAQENALARAVAEAAQARAEAAEAKARLETAERGRKNAAWVAARLKNKIAQNAPEPPKSP